MATARIIKIACFEDYPVQLIARVVGNDGERITQATISTITYKVIDTSDNSVVVSAGTLTVASVIFDSLQTDKRWTEDTIGYNFLAELAGTSWPNSGRVYRVEIIFTPASGSAFPIVFEATATSILGS